MENKLKDKHVGILTFQFGDNYGAVLQAYALREKIISMGIDADVINYFPGGNKKWYTDDELQKKFLVRLDEFRKFKEEYIGISPDVITSENDERMMKYSHYITGSDQVWNTSFPFVTPVYFLDFVPKGAKRISYAASVGISEDNPGLDKIIFEKYIKYYDHISVREKVHESFIRRYAKTEVETVLDPTMLLNTEQYDEILPDIKEEPFIFLYFLRHDLTAPLILSFVNMLSRKTGLKVIHNFVEMPGCVFKNDNRTMYYEDPRSFIWYIKNAEYVVTNSFHGTVFSLLYKKPFYTYVVESMSSRIYNLLENVNLTDRVITGYKNISSVTSELDFSAFEKYLSDGRTAAEEFLRKALGINGE